MYPKCFLFVPVFQMTGSPHKPPYFSLYHTRCRDLNTPLLLPKHTLKGSMLKKKQKTQGVKVNLLLFVPSLISVTIPLSDSQADPRNEAEPRDCYLPLTGMSSRLHHPFASSMITWSPMFAKKSLFFLRAPPPFSRSHFSSSRAQRKEIFIPPLTFDTRLTWGLHHSPKTRLLQWTISRRNKVPEKQLNVLQGGLH